VPMSTRSICLITALISLIPASQAHAAGFALAEQGAQHQALAGATTAREDIGSVGFSNPAAYLMGAGLRAMVGASLVRPTITHTSPQGQQTDTESALSTLPQLHVGGSLHTGIGVFGGHVAFFAPYGSSVQWPDGWSGRYEAQRTRLQVLELNAGAGFSPARWLAISAGPRLLLGSLDTGRAVDTVDPTRDTRVAIATSGRAVGWQVSAMSAPIEQLTLGASFRSAATIDLSGTADFSDVPIELSGRARDTKVTSALPTPARLALGAAWDFGQATLSLDAELFLWSSFEALRLDFEDDQVADVNQIRRWEDTVAIRLGWEQRLVDDQLSLRGGLAWDPSPGPADTLSPSSPDTDRVIVGLGVGWGFEQIEGLRIDGSLGYTALLSRAASDPELFPGSYAGQLLVAGLSVGVQR
jgi:long-chain fatty acid transport protein